MRLPAFLPPRSAFYNASDWPCSTSSSRKAFSTSTRWAATNNTKSTSTQVTELFQDHASATFLGACTNKESLSSLKCGSLPEVIVTGRANVGKSTLLNSVLGRTNLLNTSKKAGRTRSLNFYRLGREPGKAVLVDAPGYGSRGRPEWGDAFDHYLDTRKELRRIFILINASHGLKDSDLQMLEHLSSKVITPSPARGGIQPFTIQAILTKADMVPNGKLVDVVGRLKKELVEKGPFCLPPIVTSANMKFGVEEVRRSVAEACGLLKR